MKRELEAGDVVNWRSDSDWLKKQYGEGPFVVDRWSRDQRYRDCIIVKHITPGLGKLIHVHKPGTTLWHHDHFRKDEFLTVVYKEKYGHKKA